MKILMSLFVLGLGFSAQASCPDVSGKFGAMCTQVKTCTGTSSQVYVGFDIAQNGCNEVTIQRLSPWQAILTTTYPVGTATRSRSNLNTFLSYTEDGLKFAMGGSRSSITSTETLTKVVDGSGVAKLQVESDLGSAYCSYQISCELPSLAQ